MYSADEKVSQNQSPINFDTQKLFLISTVVCLSWCRSSLLWGWGASLIGWVGGGDRAGRWRSSIWSRGSLCRVTCIARM